MLMINEIYVLFTWGLILDDLVEQTSSIPSCSAIRYLVFFVGAGIIPNSIKNKNYGNTEFYLSIIYQYLMYMCIYKYSTMLCRLNLRKKTCLCLDFFILNLAICKLVFTQKRKILCTYIQSTCKFKLVCLCNIIVCFRFLPPNVESDSFVSSN